MQVGILCLILGSLFVTGFQQQLQNVKVVDPQGHDVTPSLRQKTKKC